MILTVLPIVVPYRILIAYARWRLLISFVVMGMARAHPLSFEY